MKIIWLKSILCLMLAIIALGALLTQLAAAAPTVTFTVTKTADTNDGTCNADCSLREAIGNANAVSGSIVIVPAGTYNLTLFGYNEDNNATGDLDIKANMIISSAAATKPIIQASSGSLDRVMQIMTDTTVVINNVTISNGTSNIGGGIFSVGNLTLNSVNVISNSASWGGGLYIDGHALTITGGQWQSNTASIIGGGFVNQAGSTWINGTTFLGNTADRGAGLANVNNFTGTVQGTLTMINAQVLSNTAPLTTGVGAGIYNDGLLTMTNTSVNYNRSGGMAGGLYNSGLTTTISITGSQFVSNTAGAGGGGIFNYAPMILTNTIIQSNTATGGGGLNNNLGAVTMTGGLIAYNVATDSGGSGGGVRSSPYLKLVGVTVRNNKSVGSGGGIVASGQVIVIDGQIINNDAFQGGGLSTENATLDHTLVATNTATYGGGLFNGGTTSLINGSAVDANIGFQGGGVFNNGTLIVNNSSIRSNTTITYCLGCSNGAGVYNAYNLQLDGAIIASNQTESGSGAGVFNASSGNVTAVNSAIVNNTAGLGSGGGISNTGNLSMTNVTLSGNAANLDGGGLANTNSARLSYVTVANNTADNDSDGAGVGGGVATTGVLTLTATIIGNNQVKTGLSADCYGTLNSADYNVLETMANCTLIGATANNHINIDPALTVLENLDGTWVHELWDGSVAINNGDPAYCPTTDQRGVARPIGAACDIGAFESPYLSSQTITFNPLTDHLTNDPPYAITATASSGLAVSFNASGVCGVNAITVTLSGVAGSCTITATQSGNATYTAATPVAHSFTVSNAPLLTQTITFAPIADRLISDSPFAVAPTASSGLSVTITSLTTSVCSVTGNLVTLLSAGTCTLHASQSGNATYAAAPNVDRSFTVKPVHKIYLPVVLR